jgi:PIN domain nuclease of toxin-antitoxin system
LILLDTCVLIFAAEDQPLREEATRAIEAANKTETIYVSPITAWEIGSLVSLNRVRLFSDPATYFKEFLTRSGSKLCSMDHELLIASSFLPGSVHKDPMDRILIETARRNNLTLLTRDRAILAYGAEGHVKTLAC